MEPDQEERLPEGLDLTFTDSLEQLRREMKRETGVRDLWRVLMMSCLGILMLEGALAWRFSQ